MKEKENGDDITPAKSVIEENQIAKESGYVFFLTKRIGKSLGGSKFWDDGAACERRWTEFILVKNTNGETKLLPAETEEETESGMH